MTRPLAEPGTQEQLLLAVPSRPAATPLRHALLLIIVLLGIVGFAVRGIHDEREALKFRDFKQPYASARCLLHGCNPYSEDDTKAEFLRAGGNDEDAEVFAPYSALYPPFSFAVLAPIAMLDYRQAHFLWLLTIAILFAFAVLMVADLCQPLTSIPLALLLAVFTLTSTILLMLGQISGPVLALMVIGFWALVREKPLWVPIVTLTLALTLKPHDVALPVCYLLFAGARWRRAFLGTAVLTAAIVIGGTLWCASQPASAHWLRDLQANLAGNASSGQVNDPAAGSTQALNMANLQPLIAAADPVRRTYNLAAEAITVLLLAAWVWPAARMKNSSAKHLLAIASISCLMLLPIYHRQYDTRVLLLVFPGVAALLAWRRSWGWSGLLLLAVATVATSHQYLNRVMLRHAAEIKTASALKTIALYRPLPIIELVLAVFLVAAFVFRFRESEQERPLKGPA